MALPNYLRSIKSSGMYRFTFDKSEIPGEIAENLRLIVGYSERGPFNTPVYVDSPSKFINIFGGINKKLERRGCFFHRMTLQALTAGPVVVLNLKPFNTSNSVDEYEKVGVSSFNVSDYIDVKEWGIENVYNTTRFWTLEADGMGQRYFDQKKDKTTEEKPKYITLSATDSIGTSCTVFMRGYRPDGYGISFAEWYSSVLNGEEMPSYLEGHEYDKIEEYFVEVFVFRGEMTKEIATSESLGKYFYIDGEAVELRPYLENAFGEKIDTLTALSNDSNSNFVGWYSGTLLPQFKNSNGGYISIDLAFNADYDNHKMMMNLNMDALFDGDVTLDDINVSGWKDVVVTGLNTANPRQVSVDDHSITMLSFNGLKPSVSLIYTSDGDSNTVLNEGYNEPNVYIYIAGDESVTVSEGVLTIKPGTNFNGFVTSLATLPVGTKFIGKKEGENVILTITKITSITDENGDITELDINFDNPEADPLYAEEATGGVNAFAICNTFVSCSCNSIRPSYFNGYVYGLTNPTSAMKSKLDWQTKILNTLNIYDGIRIGLTSRKDIQYKYLIDTFESFVGSEIKSHLTLIAKEKENALALCNFPDAKTFKNCDYTSFTDKNGRFQTRFIKDGGNKQKPIGIAFSLPSEGNGASFASFNTPIVLSDGTIKTTCPSAALVSNNFVAKYDSRFPYSIVAGPVYGNISVKGLVGPDFNYSRADLDILEPMGVNVMIYEPGRGTYINSNQTAKQNPVTALSKINVRELVTFLQDEIEKMMQGYQWEFNTQALRDTLKAKADTICAQIVGNGGMYAFLNVCDETNNTDDVINNEMLVLDTSIEPGMGCGKMVQTLTIYRKGGMTAVIN